ncbi:MAG TPA: type II secretion system F family protein [Janthinobacterium sp.]|jgi:tight adherence protein C|nr:type II secretion system F family protein [Janthinobacterium sp.]
MLILAVLTFLAIFLALSGLFLLFATSKTRRRLQAFSVPGDKPGWTETVIGLVGPFARLSTPSGNWEGSALRVRFLNAGIRSGSARPIYFGAKTLLPLAMGSLAWLALGAGNVAGGLNLTASMVTAALAGCYLPNLLLYLKRRQRMREIFETFPDAADLMLVCVEAGLGLDAGLARVADEIKMKSVALAEELHLTNLEVRAGGTREKSLRNLALRSGVEEISVFAAMLAQADRFGTSIGDSLRVFSDDLRHKRQMLAEERAAKVPTKMLFPLVVCVFPSIIMVIMGPAAIQIIRTILPSLAAGM